MRSLDGDAPPARFRDYSILGYACAAGPSHCRLRHEVKDIDFTPETVARELDCPDPRKDECEDCLGILFDPSGGKTPKGGDAVCVDPSMAGPGATLRYTGRGAGHPNNPGTADWNQVLGRYWSHDYAERIVVDPDEDHVWLITRWATFREFTKSAAETVYPTVSPSDEYRTLEKTASGWTLTDLDGTVTEFDAAGLWLSTTDRNGNATTATYSAGQLTSVEFPDGRREDFGYDAGGRLTSITEVTVDGLDSRTWSYTWSGDDLVRIDRPDGTAWVFTYGDPAGYMTLMELEGTDATRRVERGWEYDAEGNAVRTWKGAATFSDPAAVDTWELAFDDPALPTVTTVTDPLGNVATYTVGRDPASTKPRVEAISGDCPACGLGPNAQLFYEDAANPLRVTKEVAGDGVETHYTYDASGQLLTQTEAASTVQARDTTWTYDSTYPALVTEVEQPSVDGVGFRRIAIGRNASGDPEARTIEGSEAGAAFSYETATSFNAAGRPLTVDPPGYGTGDVTSFAYDPARGDLVATSRTDPLVGTTSFGHDGYHRRTSVTDPNGVTTDTGYDALDRVTKVIQRGAASPADDLVTEHLYDVFGDLVRTILPAGNLVDYAYDAAGRLVSIERRPDAATHGERTVYTLDAAGNRTREELQRWDDGASAWITGSSTDFLYTTRCQLDRIDHPDGTSTEYAYDCAGNLTRVWDAAHPSSAGAPTQIYEYDALDSLVRVRQPWPEWAAGWDDADPANEAVTTSGYDIQDHLISVIDAEGNETTYAYSDRDLLTQEVSPVSGTTTHAYNEHGELVSTTDARGILVQRTVDELDRVTFIDSPDPSLDTTYIYDTAPPICGGESFPVGRLGSILRGQTTVTSCYDGFGRPTRDGELTYAYDPNGNLTDIAYPGAVSAEYAYDFADRQTSLTVTTPAAPIPVASGATYLPSGPLSSLALGNGTTETRAFTTRYFPASIAWSGPPERTWTFTTDAIGNVTSIERTIACAGDETITEETFSTEATVESCADLAVGPNVTLTATADVDFRATGSVGFSNGFSVASGARMRVAAGVEVDPPELRLFDYQDGPYFLTLGDGPWGERDWTYDRIGNRTTETRDRSGTPETDTYDYADNPGGGNTPLLDQVLLAPSGTADYAWDPAGNLDTLTRGANLIDFTFDDASRLAAIDRASDSATFLYDGRSFLHCVEDPSSTATVEPVYDSSGLLHALLEKDTHTGPERRHTVFYLAGRPLAQLTQDGGAETWYYLTTDHLGTPLLASDETGGVLWTGGFEPFGHDFAEGTVDAALANNVLLRFPGQWESELWADASFGTGGLYYNVHRWYQPGTGRYTRPDPLGLRGSRALMVYGYAEANPINVFDPFGLCSCTDDCPGGEWTYFGGSIGFSFVGGIAFGRGFYQCDSNTDVEVKVKMVCALVSIGSWAGFDLTTGLAPAACGCNEQDLLGNQDSWFGGIVFFSGTTSSCNQGGRAGGIGLGISTIVSGGWRRCDVTRR